MAKRDRQIAKAPRPQPPTVPLSGELAEFRDALLAEVDAAKKASASNAVRLSSGRLLARLASGFQYQFSVETVLDLPGDTPGELKVPNLDPIRVTIISIEGLTITLSVEVDLGPYVPFARLESSLAMLLLKLIERIEAKATVPNPAGDHLLGRTHSTGDPEAVTNATLGLPVEEALNAEQLAAVGSALGRNITYIWGPPGTGKTHTIGALGAALLRRKQSVLVVSHTNTAVDGAILHIAKAVRREAPEEIDLGKIVRVGTPKSLEFQEEKNQPLLLSVQRERRAAELALRKDVLLLERGALRERELSLSQLLQLHELLGEAESDVKVSRARFERLCDTRERLKTTRAEEHDFAVMCVEAHLLRNRAVSALRAKDLADGLQRRTTLIQAELSKLQAVQSAAANTLADAERLLIEVNSVNWIVRKWRQLPDPEEQGRRVNLCRQHLDQHKKGTQGTEMSLQRVSAQWLVAQREIETFRLQEQCEPESAIAKVEAIDQQLIRLRSECNSLSDIEQRETERLESEMAPRLSLFLELGLVPSVPAELADRVAAMESGIVNARLRVRDLPLAEMEAELAAIVARLHTIAQELDSIEESLRRIEEMVIREALVVGSTLTAAYLRDPIQTRRFDTVILDEASMAAIPALWIAATVCDRALVVVGDYRQLPPVVKSKDKLAEKWLGTDPFELANLTHDGAKPDHFVTLQEQQRMHPKVSAIANALVYNGKLRDHSKTHLPEHSTVSWLSDDWPHASPVLLVDTEPLNAWVTSVSRGGGPSRLNFMSATVCADIAARMLRQNREAWNSRDDPRILMISPYKPHAKLLSILLKEDGISGEVLAGTVHSFQGSQADVVVFDLVNDTPHWRVGHFVPKYDETTRRLINVAVTRAKKRLIVVGDFNYCQVQGKKAFLGRDFIPFLASKYPKVSALEVVPYGLAGRASAARTLVLGGMVEAARDRVIVLQDRFYALLTRDLHECEQKAIIYSPFITQARLSEMETHLKALIERGISVYVVTKSLDERATRERREYQVMERALTAWGVRLIHKKGMHEKLVLIDSEVVWTGSLNPLSFRDTQEIMERRKSTQVHDEYAKTLKLQELLDEFQNDPPSCPVCESAIMAAEGSSEPYYWKCSNSACKFIRNVNDASLRDGIIRCKRCGGDVRLSENGPNEKAMWICDKRHMQVVKPIHLLLPEMRTRIPRKVLTSLEKHFKDGKEGVAKPRQRNQSSLFGEG